MCILLLTGISPLTGALELSFDAPQKVEIDEEFEVSITLDSEETFDVKIFVHTSNDEKIARDQYISEIYNGEDWSDSWYYLKEAYPEEDTFEIKVVDEPGDRTICTRVRSASDAITTECEEIEVDEEDEEKELNGQVEKEIEYVKQETAQEDFSPKIQQEEIIMLNAPQEQKRELISTSTNTNRLWLIYSFSAFSLLIIILLALRKL